MTTETRRPCLTLMAVAVLSTGAAAAVDAESNAAILERSEVQAKIASPNVRRAEQALAEAVGPERRDWALARAIVDDPELDTTEREYLIHGLLTRARNLEPDDAARAFADRFADHRSQIFVRHEEGPLPIAAYPIAEVARGTLRYWQRQEIRHEAATALAAGDMTTLRLLRQPGDDAYAAALAALEGADGVAMSQAADWLDANAGPGEFRDAQFVVAIGLRDAGRISDLLGTDSGAGVRRLPELNEHFGAAIAFELLQDAATNPALASAALFEIDALRHAGLGVDAYLLGALADPALGGTAATVIAGRNDPELLAQVAAGLPSANALGQARAVLALTLADDQYSRSMLEQAIENDVFVDPDLRREVVKWLQ